MKHILKHIITNTVVFLSVSAIFVILAFYKICRFPYHAFIAIRNAYREDKDNERMHRNISDFLSNQCSA